MEQKILEIKVNTAIAKNVYTLVLEGDIEEHRPGQFINIKIPGMYLRRPLSVCGFKPGRLTVCYKAVGEGTKALSTLKPGEGLDVLTGLGNGYDLSMAGEAPLLIGGGMGCAPLYFLAETLSKKYTSLEVLLGFNAENEIFYKEEFENLGCRVKISTVDGSVGTKGFVTDILPKKYSYFFCCGPMPMMKAVNRAADTSGQFSLEERMGCGFGACMGCSLKVRSDSACGRPPVSGSRAQAQNGKASIINSGSAEAVKYKRICKEGPVFKREEIIWED